MPWGDKNTIYGAAHSQMHLMYDELWEIFGYTMIGDNVSCDVHHMCRGKCSMLMVNKPLNETHSLVERREEEEKKNTPTIKKQHREMKSLIYNDIGFEFGFGIFFCSSFSHHISGMTI